MKTELFLTNAFKESIIRCKQLEETNENLSLLNEIGYLKGIVETMKFLQMDFNENGYTYFISKQNDLLNQLSNDVEYVDLITFCKGENVSIQPATLRQRILRGMHPNARKESGIWMIPKNEMISDHRYR